MDKLFSNINNLYNKKGFLERYGSDVWMTIIIMIIFILLACYVYTMNHIQPIIHDWNNSKCSPAVIPFAGLINKPANMSAFEFTGTNFTECIHTILANMSSEVFAPIDHLMHTFIHEFKEFLHSLESIRSIFNKIRLSFEDVATDVMSRLLNVTMPIVQFIIIMKDTLSKIIGTLTGTLYTLFGSYLTLKSLFLNIINFIIIILVALSASIAALLIIAAIPIIGTAAEIAVIPMIATMIAILIPTIAIKTFMKDVFKLPTRAPPGIPGCFSKNTIVVKINKKQNKKQNELQTELQTELQNEINKSNVTIDAIEIGDFINDTKTQVTGIIKFSAKDQHIYNLYDVIVTGEHRVFHDTLGWMKVKNHPDSIFMKDFNEPYVYCLLTNIKEFKIGNIIYSDWDDVDKEVMTKLIKNCSYLPKNFKNTDIHSNLNNGFYELSKIKLLDGSIQNIKDINVHDILNNGENVLGVVKIDATKLNGGLNKYNIPFNTNLSSILEANNSTINNVSTIISSKNIQICDIRFKNINTFELNGKSMNNINSNKNDNNNIQYLYQLLTDTGNFEIDHIKVRDYNYGIDKYLL